MNSNRKFALLIGINYFNSENSLNGCINDIVNMKNTLITKMGYNSKNIIMLRDDSTDIKYKPTKNNILYNIYRMIVLAKKNQISELLIHYSGHGTYVQDTDGDENDSKDECIVPCDFEDMGVISDDTLQYYLSLLPNRTFCFCLFDSCHSGTVLDLQHSFNSESRIWETNNRKVLNNNIILISGSKDDQYSSDFYNNFISNTNIFPDNQSMGALTCSFLITLYNYNYTIRLKDIIGEIQNFMTTNNFEQVPQMTASSAYSKDLYLCLNKKQVSFLSI